MLYKTNYRSTITSYADKSWRILGYHLSEVRVFAFGMSVVILTLLYLILSRTEFGRTVRANMPGRSSVLNRVNRSRSGATCSGRQ